MIRFTERSVSSESDHSEIRSLDDLFPVDSDDTLSERSAVLDGKTPVDLTSSNHLNYSLIKLYAQIFILNKFLFTQISKSM